MIKAIAIQFVVLFIFSGIRLLGQDLSPGSGVIESSEKYQCIRAEEYQLLNKQCEENIRALGLEKRLKRKLKKRQRIVTTLNWPIRAASGFTDCDFYFIGAYVDQNTSTGTIQDYDCGSNTYDGHHGTDIAAWPFGFYKMDNNLVEVVAAAAGTIIQKSDGYFDRNCSTSLLTANSIIIQHADGTQALYWHMKSNSLTAKSVGQSVSAGEYLGVVGSSGSSSGPHLHFEVWTGSTNTTYNDPFSGTCNILNTNTWWNSQSPHTNPAVIKVSVNTTDIVLPGCPTTETPNESTVFTVPFQGPGLPAGYAKFYIFIRDDVSGMTADCRILNSNGSVFNSWTYTSSANNKSYIKGYSKLLPTIPGTYTFQATYNGITCSQTFIIQTVTSLNEAVPKSFFSIFPNPSKGKIILSMENIDQNTAGLQIVIQNSIGQTIKKQKITAGTNEIQLNDFHGLFFYSIYNEQGDILQSDKLIME